MLYNASAYEAVKDKRIHDFLQFVMTNDPGDNDFNKLLSDTVDRLKDNDKFRSEAAKAAAAMNLHDRDIKKAAREEGAQQKAIENAVMIVRKYKASPVDAAQDAGAPLDKVLETLAAEPAPAQA